MYMNTYMGLYLTLLKQETYVLLEVGRTNVVSIYRLDAEARCLRKIKTRGAVECGVPSIARALPTCPDGFNFT